MIDTPGGSWFQTQETGRQLMQAVMEIYDAQDNDGHKPAAEHWTLDELFREPRGHQTAMGRINWPRSSRDAVHAQLRSTGMDHVSENDRRIEKEKPRMGLRIHNEETVQRTGELFREGVMTETITPLPATPDGKLAFWKLRGERYINGFMGKKWTEAADAFFRHEFEDSDDGGMICDRGDWQFVGSYEDRRGRQCRGKGEHLVWQFTPRGDGRWDVRLVGTIA